MTEDALLRATGWCLTAIIIGSVAGVLYRDLLMAIRERR